MIVSLTGRLLHKVGSTVEIDVQGVGYGLSVPQVTFDRLPVSGEEVTLYTSFQVRQDNMALYGFYERPEKEMFEQLITVSGIGPKVALALLGTMSLDGILQAVFDGDTGALSGVPGIGRKTAERIVVDLKDRLHRSFGGSSRAGHISGRGTKSTPLREDTFEGLLALGYGVTQAREAVSNVFDRETTPPSVEDALKEALKTVRKR